MLLRTLSFVGAMLAAPSVSTASAQEAAQPEGRRGAEPPALGVRVGTSGGTRAGRFSAYDLVGSVGLPWRIGRVTGWSLDSKAEATLGALTGAATTGVVGSVGPSLAIRRGGVPIYLDGGTAAAFTSHRRFGMRNLGTNLQFISHFSVLAQVGPVNAGYRLQHMSNASLNRNNPGVNQHMLELRYTFR